MLLTGTFRRSLDEKCRFAVPKALRAAMGGEETVRLFVAPGTDGCLALYGEASFGDLGQKLAAGSPTGPEVRAFSRLFYARAQSVDLDGQGRMRIPTELQEFAGLTKEAVIVGVRDHLEVWDPLRWNAYLTERQERYDEIAERAFRE